MNIRLDSKFDHAWQWDMGHRLILEGAAPGVEVHYANSLSENALITERGGGSGGLAITDDGLGHVSILPGGSASIQDDGAGHIKFV